MDTLGRAPLAPADTFVGRTAEMAVLGAVLTRPESRLVSVTGPAGMGKSRFLREWAERAEPSGLAWLDVHGGCSRDVPARCSTIGTDGLRLLVIDGLGHDAPAVGPGIVALLQAHPELRIVASARRPLGLRGEILLRMAGLESTEAMDLFRARLAQVSATNDVSDALANQVCEQLDRWPAAIEEAAARTAVLSLAQLAQRVDPCEGVLASASRSAGGLLTDLATDIAPLDDAHRVCLDMLEGFQSTFDLEDVLRVAGPELSDGEIIDALSGLVERAFVSADVRASGAEYRVPRVVRAAVRRVRAPSSIAARKAHLNWCTGVARRCLHSRDFDELVAHLRELDRIRADWTAALQWCLSDGHAPEGMALGTALAAWWLVRGRLAEGCAWLAELCRPAGPDAGPLPAPTGVAWAALAVACDRPDIAEAVISRAGQPLGDNWPGLRVGGGRVVSVRAIETLAKQDPFAAEGTAWLLAAAALGQAVGRDLGRADALPTLCRDLRASAAVTAHPFVALVAEVWQGCVLAERGDDAAAAEVLATARKRAQELGNEWAVAWCLWGRSILGPAAAEVSAALRLRTAAVASARAAGSPRVLGIVLDALCLALAEIGAVDAADAGWTEILELGDLVGARARSSALSGMARPDQEGRVAGRVLVAAEEAVAVAKAAEDRVALSRALHRLSVLMVADGRTEAAMATLGRAIGLALDAGARNDVAITLGALAAELARSGPADDAADVRALVATVGSAAWGSPETADAIRDVLARRVDGAVSGWAALTRAERLVADLVAQGLTNREIGEVLFISPRTVQTHVSHILRKLEVTSRRELIRAATERVRQVGAPAAHPVRDGVRHLPDARPFKSIDLRQ